MKTARLFMRGGAVAGPLALVAVPKCPLCLLPLLGTAGLVVADGPALSAAAVGLAAVWVAVMFALGRSPVVLAGAALAAGAAVAGRLLDLPALGWGGFGLMLVLAVAFVLTGRRACRRACSGPG